MDDEDRMLLVLATVSFVAVLLGAWLAGPHSPIREHMDWANEEVREQALITELGHEASRPVGAGLFDHLHLLRLRI